MSQKEETCLRPAALLALVEQHAPVGSWTWRAGEARLEWSEAMRRIFAIPHGEEPPRLDEYRRVVHVEDQHLFADFGKVFTDEWLAGQSCRIIRPDGTQRRVRVFGRTERGAAGVITGAFGIVVDVTKVVDDTERVGWPGAELNHAQIRAARAWLGWTAQELAAEAGVSFSTVRRVEMPGPRAVRRGNLEAIRDAFGRHGIRFVLRPDGSAGLEGPS